jgi:hypothetical protein
MIFRWCADVCVTGQFYSILLDSESGAARAFGSAVSNDGRYHTGDKYCEPARCSLGILVGVWCVVNRQAVSHAESHATVCVMCGTIHVWVRVVQIRDGPRERPTT